MDGTIFYPWIEVHAKRLWNDNCWGYKPNMRYDRVSGGSRAFPVVRVIEDLDRLEAVPHRVIDRDPPEARQLREALDGVLDVHVRTSTVYPPWGGPDLFDSAGKLIGLEELMLMLEFESVSVAQHEEFLLQYQMPIMERFGLVSYGCCETLDRKIGMLRKIPNLRTICVGPRSDMALCAEQAQRDYVLSWRPNPAMISTGFDIDHCRMIVRNGFEQSRGTHVHLLLNTS